MGQYMKNILLLISGFWVKEILNTHH